LIVRLLVVRLFISQRYAEELGIVHEFYELVGVEGGADDNGLFLVDGDEVDLNVLAHLAHVHVDLLALAGTDAKYRNPVLAKYLAEAGSHLAIEGFLRYLQSFKDGDLERLDAGRPGYGDDGACEGHKRNADLFSFVLFAQAFDDQIVFGRLCRRRRSK